MPAMHIVMETALNTGPAEYLNMGDVAMLQVAVNRLIGQCPSASINVLTDSAENLAKYCPDAKPLHRAGRNLWVEDSFLFGRFYSYFPGWIIACLNKVTTVLERRWPALLRSIIRLRLALRDDENISTDLMAFLEAMEKADLFVVCGAGGFTDGTEAWDFTVLNSLEVAIRRGIPIAMFGQGMGPLSNPDVITRAKGIFPSVQLITLRGGRGGSVLLESLGVAHVNMLTTGDEAIELAYDDEKSKACGLGLGVNLRVASYSGVGNDFIEKLRPVFQEFAKQHNAPILPLPIAFHASASDHLTIQQLLVGYDDQSDGGLSLDTPEKIIAQAGRCRVVVTGAYHAAVFALAQGVPVVCLAASPDYLAKFLGLKDQFGLGCEMVLLDDPQVFDKIYEAIEKAWLSAETVRESLREAAFHQVELSRNAYKAVLDLVTLDGTENSMEMPR